MGDPFCCDVQQAERSWTFYFLCLALVKVAEAVERQDEVLSRIRQAVPSGSLWNDRSFRRICGAISEVAKEWRDAGKDEVIVNAKLDKENLRIVIACKVPAWLLEG